MSGLLAVGAVAAAVMLSAPARPCRGWRRLRWPLLSRPATAASFGLLPVALWWCVGGSHVVPVVIAAAVAAGSTRLVAHARAGRRAEQRAGHVLAACEGMASDLSAGQPPRAALRRAATTWAELEPVAIAAELDADVPEALRRLATAPGADQLRTVAAAWQVAHRSGTGLAAALNRVATMLAEEQRTHRLVATELAAARATARMMAALPALVLLLGAGIGGDPVAFLTGTPVGWGCLAAGLALTQAGLLWLERIADGVLGRR